MLEVSPPAPVITTEPPAPSFTRLADSAPPQPVTSAKLVTASHAATHVRHRKAIAGPAYLAPWVGATWTRHREKPTAGAAGFEEMARNEEPFRAILPAP